MSGLCCTLVSNHLITLTSIHATICLGTIDRAFYTVCVLQLHVKMKDNSGSYVSTKIHWAADLTTFFWQDIMYN